MTIRQLTGKSDLLGRVAMLGGRALLGAVLAIVLSMVGESVAWGLFVFSSSSDISVLKVMVMLGGGIGAGLGASIAWVPLDRQRRTTLALIFLVCAAGGVIGALLGYQYGANREIDCCAEPRTTPFVFAAFGATIGANVFMYLVMAATSALRRWAAGTRNGAGHQTRPFPVAGPVSCGLSASRSSPRCRRPRCAVRLSGRPCC